jgi:hypothetical protein
MAAQQTAYICCSDLAEHYATHTAGYTGVAVQGAADFEAREKVWACQSAGPPLCDTFWLDGEQPVQRQCRMKQGSKYMLGSCFPNNQHITSGSIA